MMQQIPMYPTTPLKKWKFCQPGQIPFLRILITATFIPPKIFILPNLLFITALHFFKTVRRM